MNPLQHFGIKTQFIRGDTTSYNDIKIGDTVTINPKDTRDIPRHKGMKGIVYKEYPGDTNRVYVRIKGTGYAYDKDDLE